MNLHSLSHSVSDSLASSLRITSSVERREYSISSLSDSVLEFLNKEINILLYKFRAMFSFVDTNTGIDFNHNFSNRS